MFKMIVELTQEESLVVQGPARVRVVSGEASVFGAPLGPGESLSVPSYRSVPVEASGRCKVDLEFEGGASFKKFVGSPIPQEWRDLSKELLEGEAKRLMVVGATDSGKSSLCLFLSNALVREGESVSFVDLDVGQSDLGPPTTIGVSRIDSPLFSLQDSKPSILQMAGWISPSGVEDVILRKLDQLLAFAQEEYTIVNTDGWVQKEQAVRYKLSLAEKLSPDRVVILGDLPEMEESLSKEFYVQKLPPSPYVKARSLSVRREIRRNLYLRYFRQALEMEVSMEEVKVKGLRETRVPREISSLVEKHGYEVLASDRDRGRPVLFLNRKPDPDLLKMLRELGIAAHSIDVLERVLVGLFTKKGGMEGLGIISAIDSEKRKIRVMTPVRRKPKAVVIGRTRLSASFTQEEKLVLSPF